MPGVLFRKKQIETWADAIQDTEIQRIRGKNYRGCIKMGESASRSELDLGRPGKLLRCRRLASYLFMRISILLILDLLTK
jgi:hypothetical protein